MSLLLDCEILKSDLIPLSISPAITIVLGAELLLNKQRFNKKNREAQRGVGHIFVSGGFVREKRDSGWRAVM